MAMQQTSGSRLETFAATLYQYCPMLELNQDGFIKEVDQPFCDLLGYSAADLASKSIRQLLDPSGHDVDFEYWWQGIRNGKHVSADCLFYKQMVAHSICTLHFCRITTRRYWNAFFVLPAK